MKPWRWIREPRTEPWIGLLISPPTQPMDADALELPEVTVQTADESRTTNLTPWGWVLIAISRAAAAAAHGVRSRHQWRSDRGPYRHPNFDELE